MPKGRVTRFAKATGFRRGVLGGDNRWFAIWAALAVGSWLRRKVGGAEKISYRT